MKVTQVLHQGFKVKDELIIPKKRMYARSQYVYWTFERSLKSSNKKKRKKITITMECRSMHIPCTKENADITKTEIHFLIKKNRLSFEYQAEASSNFAWEYQPLVQNYGWTFESNYLKSSKSKSKSSFQRWTCLWSDSKFTCLKKTISRDYITCLRKIIRRVSFPLHPYDAEEMVIKVQRPFTKRDRQDQVQELKEQKKMDKIYQEGLKNGEKLTYWDVVQRFWDQEKSQ